MKIGITGTTSGIGKTLYYKFNNTVNFDRVHGSLDDLDLVYEKFSDCDIFINNAYDGDTQIKLLKFFYNQWKGKNKKIISIGSSVCSFRPSGTGYEEYVFDKRALRQAHIDICNSKDHCKSILINPGPTDTKLIADRKVKKLSTEQVYNIIKFVIESDVYIPEVYLYAK